MNHVQEKYLISLLIIAHVSSDMVQICIEGNILKICTKKGFCSYLATKMAAIAKAAQFSLLGSEFNHAISDMR